MARTRMLAALLVVAVGTAATARAQVACPYAAEARSYSQACAPTCLDSGSQSGHPATSSVSEGDGFEGYNFTADAALSLDYGWFASTVHTGGSLTIRPFSSNGAGSNVIGDVFDCLTVSGGAGTARLHVPFAIQGGALASWSIGGAYVPPATYDPAYTRLTMHCAGHHYGTATNGACSQVYDVTYDASQTIDMQFELVFQVNFDDPLTIQYGPRINSSVGYAANGSDGSLQGTADLGLAGQMLPVYVTDFGGNLIPNVTVSATSGFDYLQPAPEPDAAASATIALAALAIARRQSLRASR